MTNYKVGDTIEFPSDHRPATTGTITAIKRHGSQLFIVAKETR